MSELKPLHEREEGDDSALIRRARDGDEAAFTELVGKYRQRIVGLAWRHLHDKEAALDIAQDVFLSLHLKLPTWDPGVSAASWLCRVAINKSIERARKNSSVRRLERLSGRLKPVVDSGSVRQADETRELDRARVQEAVKRLSDRQRAVVNLHFFERVSIGEVGRLLGMTANNVRVTLHKGLKSLKRMLRS